MSQTKTLITTRQVHFVAAADVPYKYKHMKYGPNKIVTFEYRGRTEQWVIVGFPGVSTAYGISLEDYDSLKALPKSLTDAKH